MVKGWNTRVQSASYYYNDLIDGAGTRKHITFCYPVYQAPKVLHCNMWEGGGVVCRVSTANRNWYHHVAMSYNRPAPYRPGLFGHKTQTKDPPGAELLSRTKPGPVFGLDLVPPLVFFCVWGKGEIVFGEEDADAEDPDIGVIGKIVVMRPADWPFCYRINADVGVNTGNWSLNSHIISSV